MKFKIGDIVRLNENSDSYWIGRIVTISDVQGINYFTYYFDINGYRYSCQDDNTDIYKPGKLPLFKILLRNV